MLNKAKHACATVWLLLMCGCQLAQPVACGPASVPATTAPGSMVYGTQRAELDWAHAQRIIGIAAEGDEGLIALAGCQGYVREVQKAIE